MSHHNYTPTSNHAERFHRQIRESIANQPSGAAHSSPALSAGNQTATARIVADSLRAVRESKDQLAVAEAMKQTMLAIRNGAAPEQSADDSLTDDERLCALMDAQYGPGNSGFISNGMMGNPKPAQSPEAASPMTDEALAAEMDRVFGRP
jgi:hypothetical protein